MSIAGARSIAVGDVDHDGNLDAVVGQDAGVVTTFLGNGTGGWSGRFDASAHDSSLAIGDVNGDGKLDLITDQDLLLGNGDGTFQLLVPLPIGGDSVQLRDLDGDGHLDILSSGGSSGLLWIALGNGDGSFRSTAYVSGQRPLAVGDLDKDGRPDLVSPFVLNSVDVMFGRCLP